jgi:hypothetical protein
MFTAVLYALLGVLVLSSMCADNKACEALCKQMSCTSTPSACLYGCPVNGCCCCGQTVDRRLNIVRNRHGAHARSLSDSSCRDPGQEEFEWSVPTVWYARRRLLESTNSSGVEMSEAYPDFPKPCLTHCPKAHICFNKEKGRGYPSNDHSCPIGHECRNLLGRLKSSSDRGA